MRNASLACGLLFLAFCVSCTRPSPDSTPIEAGEVPIWNLEPSATPDRAVEDLQRPLSAWDLLPVVSTVGPTGTIPDRVVVQFARDVVPESTVGGLSKGTVLSIEPALPGRLVFTGSSTLEFTPKESFAPGVSYNISCSINR